ncbi:MAG: DNA helicase II / ATP-dependent DNA helicase PcrA [bacterium]|nr:MAG: DNA helicase II / ATP-dependent DNA helicase PcrA [bacterium]KAF0147978.1 MAG: DNA helicase II / ATP-dependent DNA helicase PcrA [bacterium]KAF0167516.1 MAG: DNA helicase II / ATP-dependent DNA helicase PcrA [bacterium]TXT17251.1 MAG: DNA helicase II / ATP-dependent DNA helicase PcrA [bacterium]
MFAAAASDLLDALNPEQRAAVTAQGSTLVLAGAGSGKTRVLTTRIAWLVQTGQVSPMGLMAVTFTNKAAKEMLTRLTAMLPINTRGMWVGTFHGLCNRLLRAHHREAGLPQLFTILDSSDQLSAVKRCLRALNVDTEKYDPRKLQSFINQNKEAGLRADKVEAWDPYTRRLCDYMAEYDAQCQREGAVDFAELLLRAYELLSRNALLREHYQQRFRHILVDEFQDTSRLQYLWLKLLQGPGTALFAVGDDDQSIYAFRGANVANMALFLEEMGIAAPIKLTRNYRSLSTILDAANAVIAHNQGRLGKDLWTDAGQGELIRHYEANDDGEEARFVVEEIQSLKREGESFLDMAVLYRSNAQSRSLEHALFSVGIPYRVYGGLRFFERAEIKHALAYLRLAANPEDDNAFLRVVNFPARGIGARSLEGLDADARAAGGSLWAAACKGGKKFEPFVRLVDELNRHSGVYPAAGEGRNPGISAESDGQDEALDPGLRRDDGASRLPLTELVDHVVARSGLLEYYQNEKDGEDRVENLNELANAAAAFAADSDEQSLAAFLAHAALEAGEHEAAQGQDAVQLMSVHAAKGLEFHTVFITGLEEGLFPHENALAEQGGIEEERRLMYVAITRARRRLYLSHARMRMLHGQMRYGLPSRFLEELPESLVRSLSMRLANPPPAFREAVAHYAPPAVPRRQADLPFKVGSRVSHPKYGEGVVAGYQGQGPDTEISVEFPKLGRKAFILDYARLQAA